MCWGRAEWVFGSCLVAGRTRRRRRWSEGQKVVVKYKSEQQKSPSAISAEVRGQAKMAAMWPLPASTQ